MVENREFLQKVDSNRDAHSNWETADPLHWGLLNYGPDELNDRYRDRRGNSNSSESAKFELKLLLRDRIAAQEILAFGIPVFPEFSERAERIAPNLFQSHDVAIDWDQDRIKGLGLEFHDVKICLVGEDNSPPEDANAGADEAIVDAPPEEATTLTPEKRGGGRPSLYPKVKIVLDYLFENPKLRDEPAGKLLDPFSAEFKARFSTPISERNLRDHLKRYRQELAETGNNDFAS